MGDRINFYTTVFTVALRPDPSVPTLKKMYRNCIRHNALANCSNSNTAESDIDKGIGYFVENRNKSTNKQALL